MASLSSLQFPLSNLPHGWNAPTTWWSMENEECEQNEGCRAVVPCTAVLLRPHVGMMDPRPPHSMLLPNYATALHLCSSVTLALSASTCRSPYRLAGMRGLFWTDTSQSPHTPLGLVLSTLL